MYLHIDFENLFISALLYLLTSYKLERWQTVGQSSFSVGGSSAHSFHICVSPETLVSEVGGLGLIPPPTEGPELAATAVEE